MDKDTLPWYRNSYRRNLVDMHIPDWDERFMSKFDTARYVELLKTARVDTAMVYASSCLGICYWPTPYGHMHTGLGGRDLIGEVTSACREAGIRVIVYVNFWSKWAYDTYPDWRFVSDEGRNTAEYLWDRGRFGVCCFNTPYRAFMLSQIEDLCERYDFEGMWIDMIHWPYSPCYCGACIARYLRETGCEIPRTVDWSDPAWIRFQRKREAWLAEYAAEMTKQIKEKKPGATVGQQSSSWSVGWQNGLTADFFKQTDYASGDFYGNALQQTFICKALHHLTENKPFEFMTSRCPDLTEHTTTKSKAMLRAQAFSAVTNGGAFLFIDAIDPEGTLDPSVYRLMGEVYGEIEAYEPYFDPDAEIVQDVAIYLNFESQIDFRDNGRPVMAGGLEKPVIQSAMNAAQSLMNANVPYGVVTKKNLPELARFSVIVLPNPSVLDDEEIKALRDFVRSGGGLYSSKDAALFDKDGSRRQDFGLADVIGVSRVGETAEEITYLSPTDRYGEWFPRHSAAYPVMISGSQAIVTLSGALEAEVAASQTLPYVNPSDAEHFASAISNPPGVFTERPALVLNRIGEGRSVYCTGELERMTSDDHRDLFVRLICSLSPNGWSTGSDAPKSVEAVWFHHKADRRYTLRVLNFQEQLPNIPVANIGFSLRWQGPSPQSVVLLKEGTPLVYEFRDGYVSFRLPLLETFAMVELAY
ncbi:alpha-L-fucosidase [Paenibacillus sp. LHD-117]|uniref:alpha-L-fucosidase n=1 Tax=Paenibacillus sp. LHD-117 TaxID=3071412 RepID=UPI0027DFC9C2|nr:alpha-L-fucosidase [Paenibacillus sp. LHD-117]MDQ6419712.1 alpha-L-fucosidase [Paenibacillus sp. LHD-117]